jgi:hypothetical protein
VLESGYIVVQDNRLTKTVVFVKNFFMESKIAMLELASFFLWQAAANAQDAEYRIKIAACCGLVFVVIGYWAAYLYLSVEQVA